LDLQHVPRELLQPLRNAVPALRAGRERLQHEHVESAVQLVGVGAVFLRHSKGVRVTQFACLPATDVEPEWGRGVLDVHFRWIAGVSLVTLSLAVALRPQSTGADPFAILKPDIAINQDDRQKLDERDVVLKILPATDHELAVLAAGALNASSAKLAEKINDIARLKRSG